MTNDAENVASSLKRDLSESEAEEKQSHKRIALDSEVKDKTQVQEEDTRPAKVEDAKDESQDPEKILEAVSGLLPPSTAFRGPWLGRESDVGVTSYLRSGPGVRGVVKQRFSDFLVYEINQQNETIRLKDIQSPAATARLTKPAPTQQEIKQKEESAKDLVWPESADALLAPRFLNEDQLAALRAMVEEGQKPPTASTSALAADEEANPALGKSLYGGVSGPRGKQAKDTRAVISSLIGEKVERTAFHACIRETFAGKLDTETREIEEDGKKGTAIAVRWGAKGKQPSRGKIKDGAIQPGSNRDDFGQFVHFTMMKSNRDSQDAINGLSRLMHLNPRDFTVAGTKDKRAITTQRVCVKRGGRDLESFWRGFNNCGRGGRRNFRQAVTSWAERGVRIGDLAYAKENLGLGMLNGNKFVITLRSVDVEDPSVLDDAVKSLKESGFINYYGLQRFSTSSIPTHSVGLSMLQGNWDEAVSLILRYRPDDNEENRAARVAWLKHNDVQDALYKMQKRNIAERAILEHIKRLGHAKDSLGALLNIPKNLRTMYVHAYQSYIWNRMASERVENFGHEKPVIGDLVLSSDVAEDITLDEAGNNSPVICLSEENLSNYSIFDVVIPLPGYAAIYPDNMKESFTSILKEDGLDINNLRRSQRDFSLSGAYRKLLHRPRDVSHRKISYNEPNADLAQAEEDLLIGLPELQPHVEGGKYNALRVEFSLGTAAYATMALREILKWDTGTQAQKDLGISLANEGHETTDEPEEAEAE